MPTIHSIIVCLITEKFFPSTLTLSKLNIPLNFCTKPLCLFLLGEYGKGFHSVKGCFLDMQLNLVAFSCPQMRHNCREAHPTPLHRLAFGSSDGCGSKSCDRVNHYYRFGLRPSSIIRRIDFMFSSIRPIVTACCCTTCSKVLRRASCRIRSLVLLLIALFRDDTNHTSATVCPRIANTKVNGMLLDKCH